MTTTSDENQSSSSCSNDEDAEFAFCEAKQEAKQKSECQQHQNAIRLLQAFFAIHPHRSSSSSSMRHKLKATSKKSTGVPAKAASSKSMPLTADALSIPRMVICDGGSTTNTNTNTTTATTTTPTQTKTPVEQENEIMHASLTILTSPSAGVEASKTAADEPEPSTPQPPAKPHLKLTSNWKNVPVRRKSKKPSPKTIARRLTRKYKSNNSSWYHSVAEKNRLGSIHEDIFLSDSEDDDDNSIIRMPLEPSNDIPVSPGTMAAPDEPPVEPLSPPCSPDKPLTPVQQAKRDLLHALNQTKGDSNTPAFQMALQNLVQLYQEFLEEQATMTRQTRMRSTLDRHRQRRGLVKSRSRHPTIKQEQQSPSVELEGIGISAGKPSFPGCIGRNAAGDPLYKLGTMSFDMFCPTQLVVSIQGTFVLMDRVDGSNPQAVQHIPQDLLADVRFGSKPVRSYDIVTAFTIEPWKPEFGEHSPNKTISDEQDGIRGVMTTKGFMLPYPKQSHRFSVWFTGGTLEVVGGSDNDNSNQNKKWCQIFDNPTNSDSDGDDQHSTFNNNHHQKRTMTESGKLLAAKLLMGASTNDKLDQDGKLSYTLTRPLANHIDLIYLDKTLQVLRASSGTVYVHVRLPGGRKLVQRASNAADGNICSAIMLPPLFRRPSESFVLSENDLSDSSSNTEESTSSVDYYHNEKPNEILRPKHDVWALPATIDPSTQRKAMALLQGGKLKQAAEMFQRGYSGDLQNKKHEQVAIAKRHENQFRRTVSENNLEDAPIRRKRFYALEA